jgi:hypothetical protein
LPGGFASVDQDPVNALLANDVGVVKCVGCWSSYELASDQRLDRFKSRRSDSITLDRLTNITHLFRFSASEETVDGRSPLPSGGLRMAPRVIPPSIVSRLVDGTA